MDDFDVFNFCGPDKVMGLSEFVNTTVTSEMNDFVLEHSQTLLLQSKPSLITYLNREYPLVEEGKFVEHVCQFNNVEKQCLNSFMKMFLLLEKVAMKMERKRKFIKLPDENDNGRLQRILQKKLLPRTLECDNSVDNRSRRPRDPRPNDYVYKPPESIFACYNENSLEQNHFSRQNSTISQTRTGNFSKSSSSDSHRQSSATNRDASRHGGIVTNSKAPKNVQFSNTGGRSSAAPSKSYRSSEMPPRSFFDDVEEEEEVRGEEPVPKRRRLSFAENVMDNEGKTAEACGEKSGTASIPYHDHDPIDLKVVQVDDLGTESMVAFANQPDFITAPSQAVYEKWPRVDYYDEVVNVLTKFRHNSFEPEYQNQKPFAHLIIKDSLLLPSTLEKKFKRCMEIVAQYPRKIETILEAWDEETGRHRNDYTMSNVIVSIGFDMICYDMNVDEAVDRVLRYFRELALCIRKAFDPNGPKRYRYKDSNAVFKAQMPRIIFVTVPYINSHPTASTYKPQFIKLNNAIQKFVKEHKNVWLNNYGQIIDIYDWAKEAEPYGNCDPQHYAARYKIFTTALSEKFQMFMHDPNPQPQNAEEEYDTEEEEYESGEDA